MTAAELAELARIEEAMTPAPWVAHFYDGHPRVTIGSEYRHIPTRADAAGIAAARNALPGLLEEVARLGIELDAHKDARDRRCLSEPSRSAQNRAVQLGPQSTLADLYSLMREATRLGRCAGLEEAAKLADGYPIETKPRWRDTVEVVGKIVDRIRALAAGEQGRTPR